MALFTAFTTFVIFAFALLVAVDADFAAACVLLTNATALLTMVFVALVFVLVFLLDELLPEEPPLDEELPDEEPLDVPSYLAHCFIVSFTLQLTHVPLGAITVSLMLASVSISLQLISFLPLR